MRSLESESVGRSCSRPVSSVSSTTTSEHGVDGKTTSRLIDSVLECSDVACRSGAGRRRGGLGSGYGRSGLGGSALGGSALAVRAWCAGGGGPRGWWPRKHSGWNCHLVGGVRLWHEPLVGDDAPAVGELRGTGPEDEEQRGGRDDATAQGALRQPRLGLWEEVEALHVHAGGYACLSLSLRFAYAARRTLTPSYPYPTRASRV